MTDKKRVNTWKLRERPSSEPTSRGLSDRERLIQHHVKEAEKRQQQEAAEKAARDEREKSAIADSKRMYEMRLAAIQKQYGETKR